MELIRDNNVNFNQTIQVSLTLAEFVKLIAGFKTSDSSDRTNFYKAHNILFSEFDNSAELFFDGERILKQFIPGYFIHGEDELRETN